MILPDLEGVRVGCMEASMKKSRWKSATHLGVAFMTVALVGGCDGGDGSSGGGNQRLSELDEEGAREICRDYAAGVGGVFWQETKAAFQGRRDDIIIQDYLTGLCGGDVTPPMIDEVIADITGRDAETKPVWMMAS